MSYKALKVWQKSFACVPRIYKLTATFPASEQYGLVSQMRRSAVSIPSNIAEGSQRISDKEFGNFLLIARGSIAELETQILLSIELQYASVKNVQSILDELEAISRMLHSFLSKLKAHRSKPAVHSLSSTTL